MKLGLQRIGLSIGVLGAVAIGGYASKNYVSDNYAQSGGYTGAKPTDASAATTMSVAITDSADPVIPTMLTPGDLLYLSVATDASVTGTALSAEVSSTVS